MILAATNAGRRMEEHTMADDSRTTDQLDEERRDEALNRNIDPSSSGREVPLDMGGGIQTGASGPGTPHRSQLDVDTGSPLAGAMDDLPDMTGAAGTSELTNAAGGGGASGGATAAGRSTDAWVSTISDDDIEQPDGDNANMGRGSDRFDASDAYTGVESDDALAGMDVTIEGSALTRDTAPSSRRTPDRDLTGSGDSGTAGDGLGAMPGQGITSDDFQTGRES